jgi:hypothetical protein
MNRPTALKEVIDREMEILHGCVRDILTEEFGESFHEEMAWSVSYWRGERYCWAVRCGEYRAEFWSPGKSAEEACRRFQAKLGTVRFNRDQCRINRANGE